MRPRLRRGIFGPDEARSASARAPEHTLQGSVRSEQRRLGQKEPPPGGLRRFSVLASLLLGHSPTAGGCSLVAPRQNRKSTQQTWSYLWNGVLSHSHFGSQSSIGFPSGSCKRANRPFG